ncbi:transposable element Tcb2 transposase [Trichonephila clavipes]|nr:transposable element Tcb2 transposase [Trichonephila clavipes]
MQSDCALRIAGRGRLTSFSVEYKTGNQSLFECAESFTNEELSRREDRHIVRNARVQPTASSTSILVQVAPSLGAPVSSRTIRRRLAEGHLVSRRPLRVLPLTPTHRRLLLEWCRARGNRTAVEWNQVVFNDESRFNLSIHDNRARVWRPRGERLNPAFSLQRHPVPTAGVMVWDALAYNTWSPLVLNRGSMPAQRYVLDILQPHVLPLMPGAIFQQDNARPHTAKMSQDYIRTVTILPWPARSPDLSPIKHIWDHLGRRVEQPTSLNELVARLQQIENEMFQDIQNLYTSMPYRIASCICGEGMGVNRILNPPLFCPFL